MAQRIAIFFIVLSVLMPFSPVFAHHSYSAEFDMTHAVKFTGKVTMVEWGNPHIYTHVETKDADGKIVVYRVEGAPPGSLECSGWKKDTLKIGQTVIVNGFRAKNLTSSSVYGTITDADGRIVYKLSESCSDWPTSKLSPNR